MIIENILIRPYRKSDYPDVKQNLIEGKMFYKTIYSKERMGDKINLDPDSILVAEVNKTVVGNIYIVTDWGPLIFGLAVRKSERNKGIGRLLVEEAIKLLKFRGFKDVNLLVRENRTMLHAMYEKWGFQKSNLYRWMYKDFK